MQEGLTKKSHCSNDPHSARYNSTSMRLLLLPGQPSQKRLATLRHCDLEWRSRYLKMSCIVWYSGARLAIYSARPQRSEDNLDTRIRGLQTHTWFGHVTRHNSLPKTILQGDIGRWPKTWTASKELARHIKVWTRMDTPTLIRKAEYRTSWRRLAHSASLMSPLRPQRSWE